MKKTWRNYLFIFTITFFILGLFNIIFAWLGFVCMTLPFVLLLKDRRKTWCQGYCPRASLFDAMFKNRSLTGKSAPSWLSRGTGKWIILGYFILNLFILTMSTVMVFKGKVTPIESIRFLITFRLPWDIPQLLTVKGVSDWAVHLSFRMYSMMFTTTILGLLLGWMYKPRTWCTVCPINTTSNILLEKMRKQAA